jgi:hypothetical protein
MLWLNNSELNVAVLDPVADRMRFGMRYCTGGYIWQVTDHRLGDLIAGPTYPYDFNWYDGTGLPDAFDTPLGNPDNPADPLLLGIGIGLFEKPAPCKTHPCPITNKEFCVWEVTEAATTMTFATKQTYLGWSLELTRTITLLRRTLRSETRVKNTGRGRIPLRWYPHPFMPLYPGGETCKLNVPVPISENEAFELLPNGFIGQKNLPWRGGYCQTVMVPQDRPVTFLQKHPKLGLLVVAADYVPSKIVIFGNRNSFSFEPYFEKGLDPGLEAAWSLTYEF